MEAVKDPAIASHLVGFCTRQQVSGCGRAGGRRCWCRGSQRGTRGGLPLALTFAWRLGPAPLDVPPQVRDNVEAVLQGLGLSPSPQADAEAAALAEVQRLLEPVQGLTWASGLPENN